MDCPGTTSIPVYRPKLTFDLKNSNLAVYVGFEEKFKFDTPPLRPTKTESSFRKLNSPPNKVCMLFPTHLQAPGSYVHKPTSCHCQVRHIPASTKMGGVYSPENHLSTVYCVMTHVLQDGFLPFQHTHKHSSPFKQALHMHTNSQPSHSTS